MADADAPTGEAAFVGAGSGADDRPSSLVVGVGASKGVSVDEVLGLVEDTLRDAGLPVGSLTELATVDARAAEPGILGAAERLGVPVVTYGAEELAAVAVPNPSDASVAAVGTPSVAEAAALVRGGELLVPKRRSAARPARATCAVVRRSEGRPDGAGRDGRDGVGGGDEGGGRSGVGGRGQRGDL